MKTQIVKYFLGSMFLLCAIIGGVLIAVILIQNPNIIDIGVIVGSIFALFSLIFIGWIGIDTIILVKNHRI